jgi:hypothetical protein
MRGLTRNRLIGANAVDGSGGVHCATNPATGLAVSCPSSVSGQQAGQRPRQRYRGQVSQNIF